MKRRKKYLKLTALVLSMVMLLACIPVYAEPVGDVQQQQSQAPPSGDTPKEVVEVSQTVIESSQSQLNGGVATASTGSSYTWYDYSIVPDGIYAFMNVGNTNRWLDVQGDSTNAGAHMQQYAYSTTPTASSSNAGLYKVTRVNDSLGLYTIRLMLNTNLTFYISGTEVLTKTIPSNDNAVSMSDMFYIEPVNGGYTIRPYGSNYCISAKNTTASGMGGAPDSYLTPRTYSEAGSRATWLIEARRTFIEEGVYAFENKHIANCWIDTEQDFSDPGHYLQQYDYADVPTVNFNRGALFKISEDAENPGLYIIRSMLNNRLSFTYSGNTIVTHQIPYKDSDVSMSDMYYIVFNNGSYYLSQYGESRVVASDQGAYYGLSGSPESRLDLYLPSEIGEMGKWDLVKYEGVHQYGKKVIYTGNFVAGETVEIETRIWSTFINVNDYTSTLAGDQDIRTARWYGGTGQYRDHWEVDLHDEGTITVHTQFITDHNNYTDNWLDIDKNIGLPFREGTYNIGNANTGRYLQIDDDGEEDLEVHNSDGAEDQVWVIKHQRDAYYTIMNISSLCYMTSPNSSSSSQKIVQAAYNGSDRQLFKLTELAEDYHYTIQSKYMENYDLYVSEEFGSSSNTKVRQKSFNDEAEWFFSRQDEAAILLAYLEIKNGVLVNRDSYFSSVSQNLSNEHNGIANYVHRRFYTSVTQRNMIDLLQAGELFIAHTHGQQSGIQIGGGPIVNNIPTCESEWLYMDDLEDVDLSNLEVALLLTCQTAAGYNDSHIENNAPVNIVEQMILCGAETVIGFKVNTYVSDCNLFAELLMSKMAEGMSVNAAMGSIEEEGHFWMADMTSDDVIVVAGNGNNTIR